MANYTFEALSDADFEDLACDLLGAEEGVRFQRFTKGRDGGIDLLLGCRRYGATVVQCKHYAKSGFRALLRSIRKDELPKIVELEPERYILATTVGLTPGNKERLHEVLAPHCHGIDDIYGAEDINVLVSRHPRVELANHKLWFTSSAVMQRLLNAQTEQWTELTRESMLRTAMLYVRTNALSQAIDILEKYHYCIISGNPGVGKTTLAHMLLLYLLDSDTRLIAARSEIGEAIASLRTHDERAVVYYDDFLGRSSFGERLGRNEDYSLLRLLQQARTSDGLRVILTTREYILRDAQRMHEHLARMEVEIARCVVRMEGYDRLGKARILYNHLHYLDLPTGHVEALLADRQYLKIIDHRKYIPRIVEWMTSAVRAELFSPPDYVAEFLRTLDEPEEVWGHAFNAHVGSAERTLMYCIASVEGPICLDDLRAIYGAYRLQVSPGNPNDISDSDFNGALRTIDGSFILSHRPATDIFVQFYDPSVRDYVLSRLRGEPAVVLHLLKTACFLEQVAWLVRLAPTGDVTGMPSGIVADSSLLRGAVERTLRGQSLRGGHGLDLLGERLSALAPWYETFGRGWLTFCLGLIDSERDLDDFATTDAYPMLSAIVRAWPPHGGAWSGLVQMLEEAIADSLEEEIQMEPWIEWSSYLQSTYQVTDDERLLRWRGKAEKHIKEEFDTMCSNCTESHEAQTWFEELASLAGIWSIDINPLEDELREWQEEHPDSPLSFSSRGVGTFDLNADATEASDDEIAAMFSLLDAPGTVAES